MDIRLIAAVGRRGQLGLDGDMPWGRSFPDDLRRFRELTTGGIVVVGWRTWPTVERLQDTHGRRFVVDDVKLAPTEMLARLQEPDASGTRDRAVWIAGGAKTYARYAPFVDEFVIRRVPYDGPADTWLPDLLGGAGR